MIWIFARWCPEGARWRIMSSGGLRYQWRRNS